MWKFIASADAYYLIPFQDKAEQCHDQNAHAVVYWRRPARQYRCSNCPSQGALIYTMKFLKTFWPSTWRLVVFFWDRRGLLNKPVAIWFLTVIAVGLFGAMFDDMSRCRVEARQALIDYNHLITEFTDRRIALSEIILSAKTLDELKSPEVLEKWKMHFTFSE